MHFSGTVLYVRDVPAALIFYERAFGLVAGYLTEDGKYGTLETNGTILGFADLAYAEEHIPTGIHMADPKTTPQSFKVCLETDDVVGGVRKAVASGAAVLAEPEKKPWGQTIAYLRDPDGHLIELATPPTLAA